jgi:hypothetical protein
MGAMADLRDTMRLTVFSGKSPKVQIPKGLCSSDCATANHYRVSTHPSIVMANQFIGTETRARARYCVIAAKCSRTMRDSSDYKGPSYWYARLETSNRTMAWSACLYFDGWV